MSEIVAAHRDLYSASSGEPNLNGGRCRACGYIFFPPQFYGCEVCGGGPEQLEPLALAARGTLSSFATVHLHQGSDIEAPFTVGVILLEAGPAVRAILAQRTDEGLRIGDRMHGVLAPTGKKDGGEVVELRFAKAESGK